MNPALRKVLTSFLLSSILLSACGSNLWGSYNSSPTLTMKTTQLDGEGSTPSQTPTPHLIDLSTSTLTNLTTKDSLPTQTPTQFFATTAPGTTITYVTQSGDSLNVVAAHFGIEVSEITSPVSVSTTGFLNPGTLLFLPKPLTQIPSSPSERIIPDSELIDSPSAIGFDIKTFIDTAGGKLSTFQEYMATVGMISGAQGVERISLGSSINPRLVLTFIQYYTGWVEGQPKPNLDEQYLFGYKNLSFDPAYPSLYQPLRKVILDLLAGYYGWRAGTLTELTFPDKSKLRIAPDLNAGTVSLQYFFSKHLNYEEWLQAIDPDTGFMALYSSMFGDPWERARMIGPLFPNNLTQPEFILPFEVGSVWTFTSGPHAAWEDVTPLAAMDFAPPGNSSCNKESTAWVVAVAPGKIVRSENYYVVLNLNGDNFEQTGWVVLYQHIDSKDRVPVGTYVDAGTRIGHPSCNGGFASGINVHIARKYNGEWVAAGDPLPFILSGWTAHAGITQREGSLTKGDQTIPASLVGARTAQIVRQPDE